MSFYRSISAMLMALVVVAASACLCTFKGPAPVEAAMAAHAHRMQAAMDMPAPCDEAENPCHVVDAADLPQSADLVAPSHISPISFVVVPPSWPRAQFDGGPAAPLLLRWRVPPPSPVTTQDRRLT